MLRHPALGAIIAMIAATPAMAGTGIPVPEPTHLALFAIGVAGIVLGRRGASKRRDDD